MDTTLIKIKKVDMPQLIGITEEETEIPKVLHEMYTALTAKKPNWQYTLVGNGLNVFQDAEGIGNVSIETKWKRKTGHSLKLKIIGHNFEEKMKGDEARRTENVRGAMEIMAQRFRGRSPKELLNKYSYELQNFSSQRINEVEIGIRDQLKEGEEVLRDMGKHFHKYREFKESDAAKDMFFKIGELEEELISATESERSRSERAVLVFKRTSTWQVVTQDENSATYPDFKDIPEYIAGKLAVMGLLEEPKKYVPNIGMKVNGRIFWVLV